MTSAWKVLSVTLLTLSAISSPSFWRLRGHTNLFCPGLIRCTFSLSVSGFPGDFVEPRVFYRRDLPGEILGHPVGLDPFPRRRLIAKDDQGLAQRVQQGSCIVESKLESCALPCFRIKRFDCIVEPARRPHHRNRTVLQAIYLIQSAWFVSRGHQKHVCPGLDFVCESVVVSDPYAHCFGIKFCEIVKHPLVFRLAGAERHDRHILGKQ